MQYNLHDSKNIDQILADIAKSTYYVIVTFMTDPERGLEKSPRWDELEDVQGRIEYDGIDQGFPNTGPYDDTEYMVLNWFGERLRARVDFSTQYRAEGLRWRLNEDSEFFHRGSTIGRHDVAAWRELSPEERS